MAYQDRDYYRTDQPGNPGPPGRIRFSLGARLNAAPVVKWLMIINVAIFIADLIIADWMKMEPWAPRTMGYYSIEKAIYHHQAWRFLTYAFVHWNPQHIFFNMLALFFFGPLMEQWWTRRRFLVFWLVCALGGALLNTALAAGHVLQATPTTQMAGASGSLFGVLIGAAMVAPHMRVMLLFPPIPMSMRTLAWVVLGIGVAVILTGGDNAGGEAAHLGGAAMGFALVKFPRLLAWADLGRMTQRGSEGRWERRQIKQQNKLLREQAEVDRILAKIKEHGLQSLTRGEKNTLAEATQRQQREE